MHKRFAGSALGFALAAVLMLAGCGHSSSAAPVTGHPADPGFKDDTPDNSSGAGVMAAGSGGSEDTSEFIGLAGSEPYYADSPYHDALVLCVTLPRPEHSCSMQALPFIAQEAVPTTIESIMNRLVVSHRWMGQRFAELLRQMPADMITLFKPVTAVVIAEDIRPSHFATTTGAMYIDPQLLWQTQDEKRVFQYFARSGQTVSLATPLKFRSWSRYVDEAQGRSIAVSNTGNLWDNSERTLDDTLMPLAALLFHELAHANDFFPPEQLLDLDKSQTVYAVAGVLKGGRPSDSLYRSSPLQSPELTHLAEVIYLQQGKFSAEELSLSAQDMGAEFDLHAANDDYAFAHQFEDAAMLFEEVMMRYHYQVSRDVAYLEAPGKDSDGGCDDYTIAWGMRNRVARPEISERAQLVTERMLPATDWGSFFSSLAAPEYLPVNTGWCESLTM